MGFNSGFKGLKMVNDVEIMNLVLCFNVRKRFVYYATAVGNLGLV